MRKKIAIIVISIIVILSTFPLLGYVKQKPTTYATVESIDGLNVFIKCKPVNKYDVIGVYHTSNPARITEVNFTNQVKGIKQNFSGAEGVIFSFNLDTATVIRFK